MEMSKRDRIVALVGQRVDAIRWIADNDRQINEFRIISNPRSAFGLPARRLHLIILPSYWELPNHNFVRVEIRLLERLGATMEWV